MSAPTLTLYPPVISTYMPAFVIQQQNTDSCRVYFSLSKYNTIEDIANVQVTIKSQYTNDNMLSNTKYPSEVMLTNLSLDTTVTTDEKYYITITSADIEGGFDYDTYYKLQIRFTSTEAAAVSLTPPQSISSWLNDNMQFFSEWSTVCLIYGISQPQLVATYNGEDGITNWDPNVLNEWYQSSTVSFVGRMTYAYFDEQEYLKFYHIKLYDAGNHLLLDSGVIYNNTYDTNNVVNYNFDVNLEQGAVYHFTFEYVTNNLYTETLTYNFEIMESFTKTLNANLGVTPDEENGRFCIDLSVNVMPEEDTVMIRRASSKDNYLTWENLKEVKIIQTGHYTIWDDTFESGVFYKYSAQLMNSQGYFGTAIYSNQVIMILNYSYLTTAERQLKIKFDTNIGSFQKVVMDSTTTTIGSKYPFVKRNAEVYYSQFPIGGLISLNMDLDGLFYSRGELLGDSNISDYNNYNSENNINNMNDIIYERAFRDKVLEFLNDDTVKLFRSPTEGNILVKITGVTLTPNTTLGRMIYSFSGTAAEIADNNIKNYEKYNIVDVKNLTRLDNIGTDTQYVYNLSSMLEHPGYNEDGK